VSRRFYRSSDHTLNINLRQTNGRNIRQQTSYIDNIYDKATLRLVSGSLTPSYIYIFIMKSYDEVQNNKKCTSTNINESKSDMHDQGDLEIQLIISLISSVVKQSGERESCFDLTCSSSQIRFRDVFTDELLCR
jgi:hypothetical protein